MATTVAPGITAPVGSVTVPVTAPVTVWAAPVATQSSTAINDPTHTRIKLIFIGPNPSSTHSPACDSFHRGRNTGHKFVLFGGASRKRNAAYGKLHASLRSAQPLPRRSNLLDSRLLPAYSNHHIRGDRLQR